MAAACVAGIAGQPGVAAAGGKVTVAGTTVGLALPSVASTAEPDYANARPLALPRISGQPIEEAAGAIDLDAMFGKPDVVKGSVGDGTKSPRRVAPAGGGAGNDEVQTEEFGTFNRPYTTNRVNPLGDVITDSYPYRAAGKLFFRIGTSTFVCSASLIRRGVVVTAAHCVSAFGRRTFYSDFRFIPAYSDGLAPYGVWTAANVRVLTSWFTGTDACDPSARGIICRNDVAVIRVTPQSGRYPGTATGVFGYGINGYGFTTTGITHVTQLGYPVALDRGELMQRNDSQGAVSSARAGNTLIGSLMTGGSSGGPWLVNLGIAPVLSGTTFGSANIRNVVIGVTSWGYVSTAPKEVGASPFTSTNIVPLVTAECAAVPAACS
jgi:V8-like Glu-specific endopeptidase